VNCKGVKVNFKRVWLKPYLNNCCKRDLLVNKVNEDHDKSIVWIVEK
jgi:hypothetical protein